MIKAILVASALLSAAFMTSESVNAAEGRFYQKTFQSQSYSGSRDREYQIYVPPQYDGSTPVPLVMVLHGCDQTEEDVIDDWHFDRRADEHNFIVVYPFITSYSGMRASNCWGFWFSSEIHEGAGEVEDLKNIAVEVEELYNIDANRRYITGLSSGGAITEAAAIAHNEYWAAAAPVAGLAYGEGSSSVAMYGMSPSFNSTYTTKSNILSELDDDRIIPVMVVQSNNDQTVQQPAGNNIRDSHIAAFGGSSTAAETLDCSYEGISCSHKKYQKNGETVVETVFYNGIISGSTGSHGHYWGGDGEGHYATAKGPSTSTIVWDFFSRHTFTGEPVEPPMPACEPNCDEIAPASPTGLAVGEISENSVELSWNINSEEDIAGYKVYKSMVSGGTATVAASMVTDTTVVINGLSANSTFFFTLSAVDLSGNESPVSGEVSATTPEPSYFCQAHTAVNSAHISAGRATSCGLGDWYACAKDDGVELGLDNAYLSSTVYESPMGVFTTTECDPDVPATIDTPVDNGSDTTTPPAPAPTCSEYNASNAGHVAAGRAYICSFWFACAEGSGETLGYYSSFSYSTVHETDAGYYEYGSCQ